MSDVVGSEHVDERDHVGIVAAFIAARLQYPVPSSNSSNPRISTIKVHQHKSKFGQVRVYCYLADTEQVRQAWAESSDWTDSDEVPADFRDRCLINDAMHYRRCYFEMASLVPKRQDAMFSPADFPELLFQKARLDEWLLDIETNALNTYLKRWNVNDFVELKIKLYKICQFK